MKKKIDDQSNCFDRNRVDRQEKLKLNKNQIKTHHSNKKFLY
jgi:hypothetical protein